LLILRYRKWHRNEFESGDTRIGARKKIFVVPLQFLFSTSTIRRFVECFCDGQYNLVRFLLAVLLLTDGASVRPCKSGGTCTRARPMESTPVAV